MFKTVDFDGIMEMYKKHNLIPKQGCYQIETVKNSKESGCCVVGILAIEEGKLGHDNTPAPLFVNKIYGLSFTAGLEGGFEEYDYSPDEDDDYKKGYRIGRKVMNEMIEMLDELDQVVD